MSDQSRKDTNRRFPRNESRLSEVLFHVTHVRTPETFPANDLARIRETSGKVVICAEQIGVELVCPWADGTGHAACFVVDADSTEELPNLLVPILTIGHAEVKPVADSLALFRRRLAES